MPKRCKYLQSAYIGPKVQRYIYIYTYTCVYIYSYICTYVNHFKAQACTIPKGAMSGLGDFGQTLDLR